MRYILFRIIDIYHLNPVSAILKSYPNLFYICWERVVGALKDDLIIGPYITWSPIIPASLSPCLAIISFNGLKMGLFIGVSIDYITLWLGLYIYVVGPSFVWITPSYNLY